MIFQSFCSGIQVFEQNKEWQWLTSYNHLVCSALRYYMYMICSLFRETWLVFLNTQKKSQVIFLNMQDLDEYYRST